MVESKRFKSKVFNGQGKHLVVAEKKPYFKVTEEEIAKALKLEGGLITRTANKLKVTRSAISQRIKKSSYLQEIQEESREEFLDLAESQLRKAVEGGNLKAIMFALRTLGKERGFVERQEFAAYMKHSGFELNIVKPMMEVGDEEEDR